MDKVIDNNKCTGCSACKNICPVNAITMKVSNDGFSYPIINKEKCINCGLCKKTCPVLNTKDNNATNKCFVGYNKDKEILHKSSSGGIFTLIANYILENNGIVIGSAFNKDNKLEHIAIETKDELDKLRGSKYLQSDLNNIFRYIKDNIKKRKILFVGTPCQVAGLKAFIKNDFNNLLTIDVICHGVPTPKLFNNYIKYLEKKHKEKLLNYNFRDKSTGWDTYSNSAKFKNKQVIETAKDNLYMKLFLADIALRESCYNCHFKLGNKYSDFTLGDFWRVEEYYKDMYNKDGVSAIIINTKLGKEIFENIKESLVYRECLIDEIINGNPSLKYSSNMNKNRKLFFKELDKIDIEKLANKFCNNNLLSRFKNKIKRILKK